MNRKEFLAAVTRSWRQRDPPAPQEPGANGASLAAGLVEFFHNRTMFGATTPFSAFLVSTINFAVLASLA